MELTASVGDHLLFMKLISIGIDIASSYAIYFIPFFMGILNTEYFYGIVVTEYISTIGTIASKINGTPQRYQKNCS